MVERKLVYSMNMSLLTAFEKFHDWVSIYPKPSPCRHAFYLNEMALGMSPSMSPSSPRTAVGISHHNSDVLPRDQRCRFWIVMKHKYLKLVLLYICSWVGSLQWDCCSAFFREGEKCAPHFLRIFAHFCIFSPKLGGSWDQKVSPRANMWQ
jgi:hypothetical protein